MDTTSIEARKKKEAVLDAARKIEGMQILIPNRGKKSKVQIAGSAAYVVINHVALSDGGAIQIYLVDASKKNTALGMKTFRRLEDAPSAYADVCKHAAGFLKKLANNTIK